MVTGVRHRVTISPKWFSFWSVSSYTTHLMLRLITQTSLRYCHYFSCEFYNIHYIHEGMCYQGVVRNVFKIQKLSLGGQFRSFNRRVSDCSSSSVVQTEMTFSPRNSTKFALKLTLYLTPKSPYIIWC